MAEYIEREAVIDVLAVSHAHHANNSREASLLDRDIRLIWEQPAADVVPVVHGRWEDVYGGKYQNKRYRCTVCQEKALFKFYQDELLSWHDEQKLSNYCPNCGAKMDLDEKGAR